VVPRVSLSYRTSCGLGGRPLSPAGVSARSASRAPGGTVPLGGAEADMVPAVVGGQDSVEGKRQAGKVTVVDPAVIELRSQLGQGLRPVASGDWLPHGDLYAPFHDLHCRPAGGRSARLLPGAVPASGRTPFGDGPPGSRGDRPATPAAGPRGGPPFGAASGLRRVGAGLRRPRSLGLLAPLAFALSGPVLGGAAVSHACDSADDPPESRHHEFENPRVHEVCGPAILIATRDDENLSGSGDAVFTLVRGQPVEVSGAGSSGSFDCCCERVGLYPWRRTLRTFIGRGAGEGLNFRCRPSPTSASVMGRR
jgi:hypothetical protein